MTTTDTDTRLLDRLNPSMRQMLIDADEAATTLPIGHDLTVSAHPDVVLERPDGHWIGIKRNLERRWQPWRGSLWTRTAVGYSTLTAAVEPFIDATAPPAPPATRGHLLELLLHARACTGETGPIPPDNWEWVGREHRDGVCACNS